MASLDLVASVFASVMFAGVASPKALHWSSVMGAILGTLALLTLLYLVLRMWLS